MLLRLSPQKLERETTGGRRPARHDFPRGNHYDVPRPGHIPKRMPGHYHAGVITGNWRHICRWMGRDGRGEEAARSPCKATAKVNFVCERRPLEVKDPRRSDLAPSLSVLRTAVRSQRRGLCLQCLFRGCIISWRDDGHMADAAVEEAYQP